MSAPESGPQAAPASFAALPARKDAAMALQGWIMNTRPDEVPSDRLEALGGAEEQISDAIGALPFVQVVDYARYQPDLRGTVRAPFDTDDDR